MGRISKYRRYVIDVIGSGSTVSRAVRGGGSSALASLVLLDVLRTMKIGRRVGVLHKLTS